MILCWFNNDFYTKWKIILAQHSRCCIVFTMNVVMASVLYSSNGILMEINQGLIQGSLASCSYSCPHYCVRKRLCLRPKCDVFVVCKDVKNHISTGSSGRPPLQCLWSPTCAQLSVVRENAFQKTLVSQQNYCKGDRPSTYIACWQSNQSISS